MRGKVLRPGSHGPERSAARGTTASRPATMTDAQLVEFATEFREGILDGRPSAWMCAMVCWPLSTLLRMNGVENESVETDLGEMNHIWLRLADGRALDPTADQFNWCSIDKLPPVYLGEPRLIHGADLLSDGLAKRPCTEPVAAHRRPKESGQ